VCRSLCLQSIQLILIIGQMDDVLVVILGLNYLKRYVPQSVLEECENNSSVTPRIMVTPVADLVPHSHSLVLPANSFDLPFFRRGVQLDSPDAASGFYLLGMSTALCHESLG